MDYAEVKERILKLPEEFCELGQGVDTQIIENSERKLKTRFPDSYKLFLIDFGFGGIGYHEICGLGEKVPVHLDLIKICQREWEACKPDYYIPQYLVPFCGLGTGDFYCFDTREFKAGECKVIGWSHEDFQKNKDPKAKLLIMNDNFTEWLNEAIDRSLEFEKENK